MTINKTTLNQIAKKIQEIEINKIRRIIIEDNIRKQEKERKEQKDKKEMDIKEKFDEMKNFFAKKGVYIYHTLVNKINKKKRIWKC